MIEKKYKDLISYFEEKMPVAESELNFENPYQLIVAVILSAQCTDKRVNMTTPALFERFPDAQSLSNASVDEVYSLIKSISYPNNKAKNLVGMAKALVSIYKGVVPDNVDDLQTLPGVGRKTANVVASVAFNKPAMAVDTHVFIASARIDLTKDALSPLVDYHVSKDLSYKDTKEIIGRFVKNWNTILRLDGKELTPKQEEMLKKAERECKYVFDQFDTSVYYNFSIQISRNKNVLLAYEKTIDRDKIARNSNVKVLVQPPLPEIEDKIDSSIKNKLKTNGKYRVYLQKDEKTVQVKFGRSSSCVIYIMYLLDRKKQGDNIDTLEIVNNKELFTSLYTQIYNDYDVKKACKTIWTTKANSSKNKLSDYYVNIRESLINAVSEFKEESSLPFYIPNKYSHITVLSDNITISDDIKLTGERCGF